MADRAFEREIGALTDGQVSPSGLRHLSDLSREQQARLRSAWPGLPVDQRRRIVSELVEMAELSVELDFRRVFMVAIDDPDATVSAGAIDGLWEDESLPVLRRVVEKAEHDPSPAVREAAVRALARFTLLAVTDRLTDEWPERLRELLLRRASDPAETLEVRRRAVEAVAVFCEDAAVVEAIESAYAAAALPMRASALYAMGRNLDLRWLEIVLRELEADAPVMRYEAARASGELGSQRAVPLLLDRLMDNDREVQLAAVAALGKLGGRAAGNALRRLLQSEDEVLREAAAEALDELNFSADPLSVS